MKKNRNKVAKEYLQKQVKSIVFAFSVLLMLMASINLKSQNFEAGVFGGAAYYLGDLNPQNHFVESDIAYGGVFRYNFNKRLSFGFAATRANLKSNADNYNRNNGTSVFNLDAKINEFAVLGDVNFFPYEIGDRNGFWTPYIFGGVAYFFIAENNNTMNHFSLPFGLGIKLNPLKDIGFNLFWSARKTSTDRIDEVFPGSIGLHDDWYIFYGLNITFAFHFKKDIGCRIY